LQDNSGVDRDTITGVLVRIEILEQENRKKNNHQLNFIRLSEQNQVRTDELAHRCL